MPLIPIELQNQYGMVEACFGPKNRSRMFVSACGAVLLLMGALFFARGLLGFDRLDNWVAKKLSGPLLAFGAGLMLLPGLLVPRNWVIVCNRGILRCQDDQWEAIRWEEMKWFEDLSEGLRQFRIATHGGETWNFLGDHLSRFNRFIAMVRPRIAPFPAKVI